MAEQETRDIRTTGVWAHVVSPVQVGKTKSGGIYVIAQYSKTFVAQAKALGGKWATLATKAGDKGAWMFAATQEREVRDAIADCYCTQEEWDAAIAVRQAQRAVLAARDEENRRRYLEAN
jgi:hypothetical protein